MVDSVVNIGPNLRGKEAVLHRPPSGSTKSRANFKSVYAKELSRTTRVKSSKLFDNRDASQTGEHPAPAATGLSVTNQLLQDTASLAHSNGDHRTYCGNHGNSEIRTNKPRRVQSAKGRLSQPPLQSQGGKPTEPSPDCGKITRRRPASAHTLGESKKESSPKGDLDPTGDGLIPFVYGYITGRKICGSDTDLAPGAGDNVPVEFPYRLQTVEKGREAGDELTDLIDFDDEDEDDRALMDLGLFPRALKPILPWLTPDIPSEWTGVDPMDCLIFLPCLSQPNLNNLPVVPTPPHNPLDELPYKEKILPPKPKETKKYDHPWRKRPVDEWVCAHSKSNLKETPSLLRIYNRDGSLLHESPGGPRTGSSIRQEIQELEKLMKGIGSADGYSIVVQYQAEINQIQQMLSSMSGRLQEIDRREAEKEALSRQAESDYCGLRAFYRDHEEVIAQIHRQHALCVQQLAALETDLGLDSDRTHFKKQQKSLPCVNIT